MPFLWPRFFFREGGLGGQSRFNHFKKFAPEGQIFWNGVVGGVWGGLPPSGISVTRALPPQVDVRTVKNLKMSSKGRTDLKIWPSKAKNLEELDFDVRKA